MHDSVKKVLVIGGGIGGMSAAIQLRKSGLEVDLVELDKDWRVYGAGISISGPSLRAFKTIGVLDQILEQGSCNDHVDFASASGKVLTTVPTQRVGGPEVPGNGGILRPVLKQILADATLAAGVAVRLGITFAKMVQDGSGVDVTFTDGSQGRYDLVIGADGLMSKVRQTIFPDAPKPKFTGQGSWRAVLPRVPSIERVTVFLCDNVKAGFNPVSKTHMYMFLLDNRSAPDYIEPERWVPLLKDNLAGFSGVVGEIRDGLNEQSSIIYRPLEALFLPLPWHLGRIVLIGDACHAMTPHLGSGAGMAVEDAVVLAEELQVGGSTEEVLTRFEARRFGRCRLAVESSVRLGEIEQGHGTHQEHAQLMQYAITALLEPI